MRTKRSRRVFTGLLFVIIGAILLLRMTGIHLPLQLPAYFFSWQMILIALGVFFMFSENNRNTGIILFVIGAVFLSRDILDLRFREIIRFAIPVLLILGGLAILYPRRFSGKKRVRGQTAKEFSYEEIREVIILSGSRREISSLDFRGGEIVCILGEADLNFRNASLSPNTNVVSLSCIFSGCKLYVPDDWTIRVDTVSIFAGVSDKRLRPPGGRQPDPVKLLVIKGSLLFSGVEIKSA